MSVPTFCYRVHWGPSGDTGWLCCAVWLRVHHAQPSCTVNPAHAGGGDLCPHSLSPGMCVPHFSGSAGASPNTELVCRRGGCTAQLQEDNCHLQETPRSIFPGESLDSLTRGLREWTESSEMEVEETYDQTRANQRDDKQETSP